MDTLDSYKRFNIYNEVDTVDKTLELDLIKESRVIYDERILKSFYPSDEGIYIKGDFKPIIEEDERVFINDLIVNDFNEILKSKKDVTDRCGKVLIKKNLLIKNRSIFSIGPSFNKTLIEFTRDSILKYLKINLPYYLSFFDVDPLTNVIPEERDKVEKLSDGLFDVLYDYIDEILLDNEYDTFRRFETSIYNNKLTIYKKGDVRLLEWQKYKKKEYETNQYETYL